MCMFALTVSTAEPKNIKEAMADSAWIEAMHEELHYCSLGGYGFVVLIIQSSLPSKERALYGLKQDCESIASKLMASLQQNPLYLQTLRLGNGYIEFVFVRMDIQLATCLLKPFPKESFSISSDEIGYEMFDSGAWRGRGRTGEIRELAELRLGEGSEERKGRTDRMNEGKGSIVTMGDYQALLRLDDSKQKFDRTCGCRRRRLETRCALCTNWSSIG
ncbi:hypothetical protein Tco_0827936 [Tanacetum coccineum]